jgi:hypothetical protein
MLAAKGDPMRTVLGILVVFLVSLHTAAADPTDLATQREIALQRLHAYRLAAEFPLDAQGRPQSMFRDAQGRLCAMASLIDSSGRHDLVDAVARTNNKLKLADVHAGPLLDWMLHSGLTQEEIAMVQGALEIDYIQFQVRPNREQPDILLAMANREIDRRIARAEEVLRAQTPQALALAAQRLARTTLQFTMKAERLAAITNVAK